MASKNAIATLKMKIVGHKLETVTTRLDDGTREETKLLRVSMRGVDGNQRTKFERYVDVDEITAFPLGAIVTLESDIGQQRLPFGRPEFKESAATTN